MNTQTNKRPEIGCYFDHANYSKNTVLPRKIIELALSFGWEDDESAALALCEKNDWLGQDGFEALNQASEDAITWLNEQENPSFTYWANEGEANAFGLWPNLESAKEDCDFVSSESQEYPDDFFRGEWLHINERGNCTLYVRTDKNSPNNDMEVWSIV